MLKTLETGGPQQADCPLTLSLDPQVLVLSASSTSSRRLNRFSQPLSGWLSLEFCSLGRCVPSHPLDRDGFTIQVYHSCVPDHLPRTGGIHYLQLPLSCVAAFLLLWVASDSSLQMCAFPSENNLHVLSVGVVVNGFVVPWQVCAHTCNAHCNSLEKDVSAAMLLAQIIMIECDRMCIATFENVAIPYGDMCCFSHLTLSCDVCCCSHVTF